MSSSGTTQAKAAKRATPHPVDAAKRARVEAAASLPSFVFADDDAETILPRGRTAPVAAPATAPGDAAPSKRIQLERETALFESERASRPRDRNSKAKRGDDSDDELPGGANGDSDNEADSAVSLAEQAAKRAEHARKLASEGKISQTEAVKAAVEAQVRADMTIEKPHVLAFSTLSVGTMMMGAVRSITALDMSVSLPDGAIGYVSLREVSDTMANLVDAFIAAGDAAAAAGDDSDSDAGADSEGPAPLPELKNLFVVGQILRCVVVKLTTVEGPGGRSFPRIELSLRPSLINAHITPAHVVKGAGFVGAVSEVVDRGYVIDMGIDGLTGFLTRADAAAALGNAGVEAEEPGVEALASVNNEDGLVKGQIIEVVATANAGAGMRTVSVTADPKVTTRAGLTEKAAEAAGGVTIDMIKPGSLVKGEVDKVLKDSGLLVRFLSFFVGTVSLAHLPSPITSIDDLALMHTKYPPGSSVIARVLSVNVATKVIQLSLSPLVVKRWRGAPLPAALPLGTIAKDVRVIRHTHAGCYIDLTPLARSLAPAQSPAEAVPEGDDASKKGKKGKKDEGKTRPLIAWLPVRDASDPPADADLNYVPSLPMTHRTGASVTVRIIGSNPLDGYALVSARPSVLAWSVFSVSDVVAGQLYKVTIDSYSDELGIFVRFDNPSIRGLVPISHLRDIPSREPGIGKARERFLVGSTHSLRVLSVDTEAGRVALTAKRSLVETKGPILASDADAAAALAAAGSAPVVVDAYVTHVSDRGIGIALYGGLHGFIPLSQLVTDASLVEGQQPSQAFTRSQVIRARVTGVPGVRRVDLAAKAAAGSSAAGRVKLSLNITASAAAADAARRPRAGASAFVLGEWVSSARITGVTEIPSGSGADAATEAALSVMLSKPSSGIEVAALLPATHLCDAPLAPAAARALAASVAARAAADADAAVLPLVAVHSFSSAGVPVVTAKPAVMAWLAGSAGAAAAASAPTAEAAGAGAGVPAAVAKALVTRGGATVGEPAARVVNAASAASVLTVGSLVVATVSRVVPYGVHVTLGHRVQALIPLAAMPASASASITKGTAADAAAWFQPGQTVVAVVKTVSPVEDEESNGRTIRKAPRISVSVRPVDLSAAAVADEVARLEAVAAAGNFAALPSAAPAVSSLSAAAAKKAGSKKAVAAAAALPLGETVKAVVAAVPAAAASVSDASCRGYVLTLPDCHDACARAPQGGLAASAVGIAAALPVGTVVEAVVAAAAVGSESAILALPVASIAGDLALGGGLAEVGGYYDSSLSAASRPTVGAVIKVKPVAVDSSSAALLVALGPGPADSDSASIAARRTLSRIPLNEIVSVTELTTTEKPAKKSSKKASSKKDAASSGSSGVVSGVERARALVAAGDLIDARVFASFLVPGATPSAPRVATYVLSARPEVKSGDVPAPADASALAPGSVVPAVVISVSAPKGSAKGPIVTVRVAPRAAGLVILGAGALWAADSAKEAADETKRAAVAAAIIPGAVVAVRVVGAAGSEAMVDEDGDALQKPSGVALALVHPTLNPEGRLGDVPAPSAADAATAAAAAGSSVAVGSVLTGSFVVETVEPVHQRIRVALGGGATALITAAELDDEFPENPLDSFEPGVTVSEVAILATEAAAAAAGAGPWTSASAPPSSFVGSLRASRIAALRDAGADEDPAAAAAALGLNALAATEETSIATDYDSFVPATAVLRRCDVAPGQLLRGYVSHIGLRHGCFVQTSAFVHTRAEMKDLSDTFITDPIAVFPRGRRVDIRVTAPPTGTRPVPFTAAASHVTGANVRALRQLAPNDVVKGVVHRVIEKGVLIRIKHTTIVALAPARLCSDVARDAPQPDLAAYYAPGDRVKAVVVHTDPLASRLLVGLKASLFVAAAAAKKQNRANAEGVAAAIKATGTTTKSGKLTAEAAAAAASALRGDDSDADDEDEDESGDESSEDEFAQPTDRAGPRKAAIAAAAASKKDGESTAMVDDEDEDASETTGFFAALVAPKTPAPAAPAFRSATAAAAGNDDDDEEEELVPMSDDEDATVSAVADRELRRAARERRAQEIEIAERALAEGAAPTSADDFERLCLRSPGNSLVWAQFMAYLVDLGDFAGARAVAERALTAIPARDVRERWNVWVAMLMLENLYGTTESLEAAAKRASQYNSPVSVALEVARILESSGKVERAEETLEAAAKRFGGEAGGDAALGIWHAWFTLLFAHNFAERARATLQKALIKLPPRLHIGAITKLAQLEFHEDAGLPERGRVMYEKFLSTNPKRLDIWSQYLDQEVKLLRRVSAKASTRPGEIKKQKSVVRALFDRLTGESQWSVWTARQMKFLFKRYVVFEESMDDGKRVPDVQEKAKVYVAYVQAQQQKQG